MQEQVIPKLIDESKRSQPRTWSLGSVADAVAMAVAYQDALGPGSEGLKAFASGATGELSPVTFSLSDIRCMPVTTRSSSFHRQDRRWVPEDEIAEQVILSAPRRPVDLVTLRDPEANDDRLVEAALAKLRDGGHLLVIGSSAPIRARPELRPVGESRRILQKCTRGRKPARSEDKVVEEGAGTLAQYQVQADLVSSHARLARALARRFSHHGEAKDDLEQVALMALVKAARRYDPERQTSFSTYASASILGELKRHFRDKTWMMRVPRSLQEVYLSIKEARESLTHELNCSPTVQQIAGRLGTSEETVLEAMEAGENYWPESLDVGIFEGDPGRDIPVVDGSFELALERHQLSEMLPRLAPRERLILKRVYFDGWTQRQVAEEIGVSQMQISRLLGRTIDKLKSWLAA